MDTKSLLNMEKELITLYTSALCSDCKKKYEDFFRCSVETEYITVCEFIKIFMIEPDFGKKLEKEEIVKFLSEHPYIE